MRTHTSPIAGRHLLVLVFGALLLGAVSVLIGQ
jgi:hypothetical protein